MSTNVKLRTLLEGLSGKGIELRVSSLARYTAENGVLVDITCGRSRGRFTLPPKLLGIAPDRWDKDCKAFYGEHVSMGKLNMVPKELEDRLNQLDTRARRILQAHTVNGSYMPLSEFEEFKEEFEEVRKDYFDTIDEVVAQWDTIRNNFIAGVRKTVETRGKRTTLKRDREKMIQDIVSAIPTAPQYRSRARMEVIVRAFPTTGCTTAGLSPDIQGLVDKTWKDDVTANIIRSRERPLLDLLSLVVIASIHAPVQGATLCFRTYCSLSPPTSIHAPVRGATSPPKCSIIPSKLQSTLPRRERLGRTATSPPSRRTSIHAPASGATAT